VSTGGGGRAAALLAVLLGAVFGFHRIVDPDVFQHVAVGRALLAHPGQVGRSSFHDLYPGRAYVEDKPLSSVVAAVADRVGGESGIAIYQLLLPALVAAAWFALLRAAGSDPWTALAGTSLALVAAAYRLEPRPDTWSHALLALTAVMVLRLPLRHLRWSLPLLFALWTNLHGYWLTGIAVLVAAALAAVLETAPGPVGAGRGAALRLLGLAAVCILACGIHPQGWRAITWPIEQLSVLRHHPELRAAIVEFQPTTALFEGASVWHAVAALAFPLAGLVAAFRRRPLPAGARAILGLAGAAAWMLSCPAGLAPWPYRLTSALTLMAAFELPSAIRERRWFPVLAWTAALAMALPLVRNLTLLPPLSLWVLAPRWGLPARVAPALAAIVLAAAAWARLSDRLPPGTVRAPGWTGWGIARDVVPVGAAAHLAADPPAGRIFNDFQSGGLLLARLPGRRVFIAGNTSLYPPQHLTLYRSEVMTGRIPVDALPARFGIDTIVLEHASLETPRLLAGLARSRGFHLVFLDEAAAVFRWGRPEVDLARAAGDITERFSSLTPLPRALGPARRLFPALNLGIFLRAYGRPDLALPLAERLWREGPALAIATFRAGAAEEAGVLAGEVPFLEEASRTLGTSEALQSRLARALFFRAVAAMARGELDEAQRDLERGTRLRPSEPGPWVALARIAAVRGDRSLARERLAQARARSGTSSLEAAIGADPVLRGLQ
jgi:hypothetical protein